MPKKRKQLRDARGRFAARRKTTRRKTGRKPSPVSTVRRRPSRKRPASDALKASDWRKLVKHDPEQLAFRKKGRKFQVRTRKGAGPVVAELPARKGMEREVKARLRLAGGERRVRDIKKVKLLPGPGWELLRHVPSHGDMTVWRKGVYHSRQGVPIGQPPGSRTFWWGKSGVSVSGKELWKAFARIQPLSWERVAEQVSDWFRQQNGSVGVALRVADAEGRRHEIWTGPQWQLESMTDPRRGHYFLSEMLAAALAQAGRRFGYGGLTMVLDVSLEIAVSRPGAPIPYDFGRPVQFGGEEDDELAG